jgi:hypothetical protein
MGSDAKIVDVRDVRDGAALPFSLTRNVHVVRADPLSCMLNDEYLVKLVQLCEANRAAARAATAAGTAA